MATGGQPQTTDNRVFLFRLQILVIDGGLLVLRNILDQSLTSQCITFSACLNQEKSTITHLKSRGVITQVQYDVLFPASGKVPTSSDLDITLIICLLRNLKCFGLNKKFDWRVTPAPTDVTIEADIRRLKDFRNKISHISTTTAIQQNDFTAWWNDIEQILIRLSSPALNIQQTIAEFISCPLDLEEERRIQEEIKKWKDCEADVDRLKLEMTDVKENVTEVKKDFEDIKVNLTDVKKDLEDVKENDTAMKRYIEDIKENVTDVKKDIDEIKRWQGTEKNNETDSPVQTEERKYQNYKKELKDGLFEFYKTRHSKIFLSPLFEEKDTPLTIFYIRPELNSDDKILQGESLLEMFRTETKHNREIYVVADAGVGKTAFSKYLANVWCQAHYPDKDMNTYLLKDDIGCMQEFNFLFLVLLRDADDLCSIDDLIFEKIVSNLGLEQKFPEDVLLRILKNEKCLVILDGLDEWIHPEKKCYRSPRSIPHRNDREKCTILTTTRPWKLGLLNLNSWQIGEKVELTKLSKKSAVTLTERILQRLKSYPNKDALQRDVTTFISEIESRQGEELTFVPLLLIYTICLWCDGVQIGNSKCELYINIVELLLSRTIQKHGDLQQVCDLSDSDTQECFAEHENCTKYYPLLMCLGKLAYYTLFNETRENTLVFDGSVAKKYLTPDEMKFTLHSGMLSESTTKTLTKKFSKVSFSHKTVQEFFAAIFVSSENEAQKSLIEKCRTVQDILDMSQIYEFICKMNADLMSAISNDVMSVINEDEKTRHYRTRTGKWRLSDIYNIPLYNLQKMFMSCLQEMPESENIQLCLQDFFIDKKTEDSEQLQRMFKQNKANIKSLYIYISNTSSSLREIIDLFSLTDLSNVSKLYYNCARQKEAEINLILFPSLQAVNLMWGEWTKNLSKNLPRLQNLQHLYITEFTLSHKILETIFNFISGQKSMKELTLRGLDCKNHGRHNCKGLNLDLSQHSTLSKLDLRWLPWRLQLKISTPSIVNVRLEFINLDKISILSRDMLNIERVKLYMIEMPAESLQNFITVLENLPQSVTVEMTAVTPETEYKSVRENIWRSQTFHVIHDYDDNDDFWGIEFKTIGVLFRNQVPMLQTRKQSKGKTLYNKLKNFFQ
ncbi:uncharacterized protein LOC132718254 [Ruditapes philippinarum]|uniref:uncharacterized protein LOC132718254 n=1 Tax=Ruditapes philippinarum TaxID=129788 RepID=UPI00295C0F74|nr:uncharacterized protein LOC132718254 [Ruditapes philippinarum]